jgi:hypothetical protein
VQNVADLNAIAGEIKPGTAVVLQLERQGMLMYFSFRTER